MFRFPLQRILDLREKKEQAFAAELASARAEAEQVRREHQAIARARAEGARRLMESQGGKISVGHLQNASFLVQQLDRHLKQVGVKLQHAEATVAKALDRFAEASKERQVLDRLRDRKLESWQAEEIQQDRKTMDEIASTRYARASAAGEGEEDA